MKRKAIIKAVILSLTIALAACTSNKVTTVNYYFDPEQGTDINAGTSPDKAFKSLSKVNNLDLQPGDSVLLKSGTLY